MEESHCGKVCDTCDQKRRGQCPGCEEGPAPRPSGDCSVAKCCHGKGHKTCGDCDLRLNCDLLERRDSALESRLWRRRVQAEQQERLTCRARFLGKWLRVLFWLFIPSMLAVFLSGELMTGLFPALSYFGMILSVVVSLVYSGVLLMLGREEQGYRTAGICNLVALAVNTLALCFFRMQLAMLLSLVAEILSLVAVYKEFSAHRDVSEDYDPRLAHRWGALWKWYLGICVAMLLSVLLAWGLPNLALLILLLADIAVIVVGIVRLWYLYRMSRMLLTWEASEVRPLP